MVEKLSSEEKIYMSNRAKNKYKTREMKESLPMKTYVNYNHWDRTILSYDYTVVSTECNRKF